MGTTQNAESSSAATRSSLLRRALQREPEAWSEMVELYGPLVAYWCRSQHLDLHMTADIVQDVFMAVSRSLGSFRTLATKSTERKSSFRGWLWTITANKIRDAARRARRQYSARGGSSALQNLQELSDGISLSDGEPTSAIEYQRLIRRALEQVRSEFEPLSWSIFERMIIDQVPTQVVAAEFNRSAAAVRQIRSRILRRLRLQLGDLTE